MGPQRIVVVADSLFARVPFIYGSELPVMEVVIAETGKSI
jgi:hypothetical protein